MSEITLTSEISVEEIQQVGEDRLFGMAARCSTGRDQVVFKDEKELFGLINFLMKSRHGSPFEVGSLTVRVHAPIKVFREWHRHRIAWSYSELSGRYADLEPIFYVPPRERPAIRPEGFKSARPAFDIATDSEYTLMCDALRQGYESAYATYQTLLALDVDRGLARDVLGVGIYSTCYCTANPRSIMSFLELRTTEPTAKRPSKPLYEIEVAARKLEAIFATHWPLTYRAWLENGRQAP